MWNRYINVNTEDRIDISEVVEKNDSENGNEDNDNDDESDRNENKNG